MVARKLETLNDILSAGGKPVISVRLEGYYVHSVGDIYMVDTSTGKVVKSYTPKEFKDAYGIR